MNRGIIIAVAITLFILLIATVYILTRSDSTNSPLPLPPPLPPPPFIPSAPSAPPAITTAPIAYSPPPVGLPSISKPVSTPVVLPPITTPALNFPSDMPQATKNALIAASFPQIVDKIVRNPSGQYYYVKHSDMGMKFSVTDMARSFYGGFGNAIVDISAAQDATMKLDSRNTVTSWPPVF